MSMEPAIERAIDADGITVIGFAIALATVADGSSELVAPARGVRGDSASGSPSMTPSRAAVP